MKQEYIYNSYSAVDRVPKRSQLLPDWLRDTATTPPELPRDEPEIAPISPEPPTVSYLIGETITQTEFPVSHTSACDRCRSREFRDVSIHDGASIRRDCAVCGRFLCFPVWYGQEGRQ